jgi:O-antigen ligase
MDRWHSVSRIKHKNASRITLVPGAFIVFIVVLAALLFGSVETWAYSFIGIVTVIFFNIWLHVSKHKVTHFFQNPLIKLMIASLTGFILYGFIQIIPLPVQIIKVLSPSTYHILQELSLESSCKSISFYPFETINEIIKIIIYAMIFFMAASLSRDKDILIKLLSALVICGFILTIFAIIQKVTWNGKIYWFRELTRGGNPFGPWVNSNHFANFMGMIVPLGLGLSLFSDTVEKKFLYIFFSLFIAIGIFFTLSRAAIVSFIVSTVFFFMYSGLRGSGKKTILYPGVFFLILGGELLYFGIGPVLKIFAKTDFSTEGRFIVWSGTFEAIKDYFFWGTGLGTFQYVFPLYCPEELSNRRIYFDAHNDYIQLMLETGLMGSILVSVFIFTIILIGLKYSPKRRYLPFIASLLASMLFMLLHSIFEFNFQMPANTLLFSALAGFVVALSQRTRVRSVR